MRLKKNVLRLLSCVAVMAAMVMLLLTGCDGGGEAPSSPAESNGTAGSNASSSSAASSESSSSSGSSSSTNTANKATKLLLYTTYRNSGEACITVLKKGDDYYMIEGNCATKTTESMVKTYLNSAKTGCNFPTAAEIATMTTGTYEVNGKEYYAEIQKKNVYGNQVRYIYCFDGNVLKYRVVEGLYYTTDMKPIKNIITYNSISTKVNENLFDLSKYSILEN